MNSFGRVPYDARAEEIKFREITPSDLKCVREPVLGELISPEEFKERIGFGNIEKQSSSNGSAEEFYFSNHADGYRIYETTAEYRPQAKQSDLYSVIMDYLDESPDYLLVCLNVDANISKAFDNLESDPRFTKKVGVFSRAESREWKAETELAETLARIGAPLTRLWDTLSTDKQYRYIEWCEDHRK